MKSNKTWHVRATVEENNYNRTIGERERERERERESQLTCAIDNRSKEARKRTHWGRGKNFIFNKTEEKKKGGKIVYCHNNFNCYILLFFCCAIIFYFDEFAWLGTRFTRILWRWLNDDFEMDVNARGKVWLVSLSLSLSPRMWMFFVNSRNHAHAFWACWGQVSVRAYISPEAAQHDNTRAVVIKNNLTVLLKIRNTPTAIKVSRRRAAIVET